MSARHFTELILLIMALPSSLLSAPVLGNLSRPLSNEGVAVSYHAWQASSFQVGETATSWSIERVGLSLAPRVSNPALTLKITGQSSFRPDLTDVRVEFETPAIPSSSAAQVITFEAKTSPTPVLLPNQTYWLVLGVESQDTESTLPGGLFEWSYALDTSADPGTADGWTFGTSTASAGTAGVSWASESTTPFALHVEASRNLAPMTLTKWRQGQPDAALSDEAFLVSDSDANGLNGLLEFAFDGDDDHLPTSVIDPVSGRVGVSYVRWSHAPELRWNVEQSTDLQGWTDLLPEEATTEVSLIGDAHERVTLMSTAAPECIFLRVRVTR